MEAPKKEILKGSSDFILIVLIFMLSTHMHYGPIFVETTPWAHIEKLKRYYMIPKHVGTLLFVRLVGGGPHDSCSSLRNPVLAYDLVSRPPATILRTMR